MPRFAFTEPSIGSTTTRRPPPLPNVRTPSSSETSVRSARARRGVHHDVLGGGVDRRRVVAALARAENRLALGARGQGARARPRGRATQARQNASQSCAVAVTARADGGGAPRGASGRSRSPSAASLARWRARSKTSAILGGRRRNAQSASPARPGGRASSRSGVYAMPAMAEAVDELDVELAGRAVDEPGTARRDEDAAGASLGSASSAARASATVGYGVARRVDVGPAGEDAVGREDLEPRVVGRDEHDEHPVGAVLRRERDRGLVAVVAVGDQELPSREERLDAVVVLDAPEPRSVDLEVGLPSPVGRAAARPRRGGRSARAARASRAGGAGGPRSPRRACARAAGRRPPRTARRGATRRSRRAGGRRRRGRRSPARGTRPRASRRGRGRPSSSQLSVRSAGARSSVSEREVDDVVRVSRAERVASASSSITSYGGAVTSALGRA